MSKAAAIRLIALALAAAGALVVFGCGGDSATETASTSNTDELGSPKRVSDNAGLLATSYDRG